MAALTPGTSLPFLPGSSINDPTKQRFHLSQSLGYRNGYAIRNQPQFEIGGGKIELSKLDPAEIQTLEKEHLELQYSDVDRCESAPFVPSHVALDKKVLHFKGYYTEEIVDSPIETERVRYVELFYYLVDDSVSMIEPEIKNSGIVQGKFLTRQRLPTGEGAKVLNWRDLNAAMDLVVYGKKIRLYACDGFTREYLTSEGIEVNSNESPPSDYYMTGRAPPIRSHITPSTGDPLQKFLTLDRVVLRFYAIWDDREQLYGEVRKFIVHFYMADDTLEIREVHAANNGRDPFPVLISRQRVPRQLIPKTYPSVEKEIISERTGFFEATDLIVGQTLNIGGRNVLLYDCDEATRQFTSGRLNIQQPAAVAIDKYTIAGEVPESALPEYNGFGSLEDSQQNCLRIVPDRPKKNYLKMLVNGNEKLRFKAIMIGKNPVDNSRSFVIELRLSDDLIGIHELPQKNAGMRTGRFLEPSRIPKPGSNVNNPTYYSINDFCIGAVITAFQHRFQITDCDLHVKNWVLSNESGLSAEFVTSIKNRFES